MNFIIPIGDFIRKGGDVMLGDLVLEDSRLHVIRDEPFLNDPSVIVRPKTVAGNFSTINFQNELAANKGNVQGSRSGHVYISPEDNADVWIPDSSLGTNLGMMNVLDGSPAKAQHWWMVYAMIVW